MRRVFQLVALGAVLTFTAAADNIVLTFEGLPNADPVLNYFNGGQDAESVRPIRAQYQGRGYAVGSQIPISTGFDLSPRAEGTRIAWQGEASVLGTLALLAGGMLEPVSRKNIQMLMDGLRSSLAYPPAQGVAQPAPSEAADRK